MVKMKFFSLVILLLSVTFSYQNVDHHESNGDEKEIQRVIIFGMGKLNAMSNNYYRLMAYETLDTSKQVYKTISVFRLSVISRYYLINSFYNYVLAV